MENTIIDKGDDKNGSTYSKIELVQKEIIMQLLCVIIIVINGKELI